MADSTGDKTKGKSRDKRKELVVLHHREASPIDRNASPIGIKIVLNSDRTVTKMRRCGQWCLKAEANFMGRARELGVPVPKVHSLEPEIACRQNGIAWWGITMDYAEGESLDQVWPRMTAPERQSMAEQIARIAEILRTVRQPDGRICSWHEAEAVMHPAHYDSGARMATTDEANFVKHVVHCRRMFNRDREAYVDRLPKSGSRIMLSHGDLCGRNIMVKDGKITAVLSWQHAGMFPEYWDYVQLCRRTSDEELAKMVTSLWPKKYAEINAIWQEIEEYEVFVPMGVFRSVDV